MTINKIRILLCQVSKFIYLIDNYHGNITIKNSLIYIDFLNIYLRFFLFHFYTMHFEVIKKSYLV